MKWKNAGTQSPTDSKELINEELSKALENQVACSRDGTFKFTSTEWEQFKIKNLQMDHYVKSGNKYFQPVNPGGPSEVTKHIRIEDLVRHPGNGKMYLLQFKRTGNKRTAATSLEAVTEKMANIFGGDLPRDPSDIDDPIPNPNYTLNMNDGEQKSITAGEEQVRCEFIAYLTDLVKKTQPNQALPESLKKLEIEEDEDDPARCSSVLPTPIGDRLEKRLMKAAKDNTPEGRSELEKVQALITKRNCGTLPSACTEDEILKIIQRATIEPPSKSKPAKKKNAQKQDKRAREPQPSKHNLSALPGLEQPDIFDDLIFPSHLRGENFLRRNLSEESVQDAVDQMSESERRALEEMMFSSNYRSTFRRGTRSSRPPSAMEFRAR